MVFEQVYPSVQRDDLLVKPDGYYKFGSLEIVAYPSTTILSRQTYSVLEWLGDVGGLNDSLYLIAQLILLPFTSFYNSSFLTRNLFRYKKKVSGEEHYANKTDKESIMKAKSLQKTVKI